MRSLCIAFVACCALGCGCSSSGNADLSTFDRPPVTTDLAGTTTDQGMFNNDAGTVVGIACGDTPCAANAQFCCTSNQGKTGLCGFGDQAATCGSALFYCDGPEDCPPAEPYCCVSNGSALCNQGMCAGTAQAGYAMCHTTPDCKGTGPCCASTSGTPYRLCIPTGCP